VRLWGGIKPLPTSTPFMPLVEALRDGYI